MLAGKITSDFLTAIMEVRFSSVRACVEYKYFNFICSMSNITGLLFYGTNIGELKGELGSGPYIFRKTFFAERFSEHVFISSFFFLQAQ